MTPEWPAEFAREEARLRVVLPPSLVIAIEHFGSTSIPGLAAKPIIDILIAVASLAEVRRHAIPPLELMGYPSGETISPADLTRTRMT